MSRSLGGSLSMVSGPREGLAKVLRRVVEQRRSHDLERASRGLAQMLKSGNGDESKIRDPKILKSRKFKF